MSAQQEARKTGHRGKPLFFSELHLPIPVVLGV